MNVDQPASVAIGTTYTIADTTRRVVGGDGVDTLDFGAFRATWLLSWNTIETSGSAYRVTDASGATWTVDFRGIEVILGSPHDDVLVGNAQTVELHGGPGNDTLSIQMDAPLATLLRGGPGDDSLSGDAGFDDLHGNQGADTVQGWEGGDWVVGGQGDDSLSGGDGGDIVYGNQGDDRAEGGAGDDIVRGGQGDDTVAGGAGSDWIAGDMGSDTISGGGGADTFHVHGGAGLEWITDFNRGEGDRLQVLPGAHATAAQVGADVVVTMNGGAQVVLVGVQLATLTDGWLIE